MSVVKAGKICRFTYINYEQYYNILILALERVPPGYPRRIPLELFSEETLRRIDGLDKEEGNY